MNGLKRLARCAWASCVIVGCVGSPTDDETEQDTHAQAASIALHTRYVIVDIGTPFAIPTSPGRQLARTFARSVGPRGEVVGETLTASASSYQAYVWRDGALEVLAAPTTARDASAVALNASGVIVGEGLPQTGPQYGVRFQPPTLLPVQTVGTFRAVHVHAINDPGVVVGSTENSQNMNFAYAWDIARGTTTLPTTRSCINCPTSANDINNAGTIVGTVPGANGAGVAARWVRGPQGYTAPTLIPVPGRPSWSRANAINDVGAVVGLAVDPSGVWTPWLHDGRTTTPLPGRYSAVDINTHGVAVGNAEPPGTGHPVRWFRGPNGAYVAQRLDGLLPPGHDWSSIRAVSAINDDGVMVGIGDRLNQQHAWVMLPVTSPLRLTAPVPGLAGAANTVTVFDATPGAQVNVYASSRRRRALSPRCAVALDAPALVASGTADPSGSLRVTLRLPRTLDRAHTPLYLQALDAQHCQPSNHLPARLE